MKVGTSIQPELDLYERDIVDMATRYGGTTFYEYHNQFSAREAAYLKYMLGQRYISSTTISQYTGQSGTTLYSVTSLLTKSP